MSVTSRPHFLFHAAKIESISQTHKETPRVLTLKGVTLILFNHFDAFIDQKSANYDVNCTQYNHHTLVQLYILNIDFERDVYKEVETRQLVPVAGLYGD